MQECDAVFIGGDGRSGTTLLIDLIGLHPQLSAIYETNFVVRIANLLGKYGWLSRVHGPVRIRGIMADACKLLPTSRHTERRGTGERFLHGPNHFLVEPDFVMEQTAEFEKAVRWGNQDEALNAFITALFAEHCRIENKPRWANKTPRNINIFPRLHRSMPGMKFIHCVRDGRAVVCSNMRRGSRNMSEAVSAWIEIIRRGQVYAEAYQDQFLEVRYERLLHDPQRELDRIFSWLGEKPCGAQILHAYEQHGFTIDSSRVGGWREELSQDHLQEFEQIAGDLNDMLGYGDA